MSDPCLSPVSQLLLGVCFGAEMMDFSSLSLHFLLLSVCKCNIFLIFYRLNVIFSKFDEVQRSGNMISSSGSGEFSPRVSFLPEMLLFCWYFIYSLLSFCFYKRINQKIMNRFTQNVPPGCIFAHFTAD